MQLSWKNDNWYTSPWNFAPDVLAQQSFASKIKIHDISLRDGEQQAGIVFNKEQKVHIAEKLAEVGIHRIEAGMASVSREDEAAIKEIVKRNLGPEIFAFSRCLKDDVKLAADCGVKGIIVEIPASEHIVKYAYRWEYEKAVNLAIEATQYAKQCGLYTVFFPIDGSRTDIDLFLDLIVRVSTEGHMDALAIVDTFGGLNPNTITYLVKKVRERINQPLEAHFHDDYGLAAANTLMALSAGVEVAHTTISGIGERAGNAAYEDIALALLTMYGIDLGLNYQLIYPLSLYMRDISKLKVRQNRGIVGEDIHKIESGIVADWYRNVKDIAPLELSPYLYSLTGHPEPEIVIGKCSGMATVEIFLKRMGIVCDDLELKRRILTQVKEKSIEIGGLLSFAQFTGIVDEFRSELS